MPFEITQLSESHLEDAAALVSARYRLLLEEVPDLPIRYADPSTILPLLQDIYDQAPGIAATRGGTLVGFILGFTLSNFMGKRSMYSPEWANGTDLQESRRIYEEMYGRLAVEWLAENCYSHLVTILPNDRQGIEAWNWLGFGITNVDAVRNMEPPGGRIEGLLVRRATLEDLQIAQFFRDALERHMSTSPIFWLHELHDYSHWLQEPSNALWLAYDGEQALGALAMEPGHPDGCQITQDEKTVSITSAFILEKARRKAVATTLLNDSLAWAATQGYKRCAVDFESMNYLAVRFWLKYFQPVAISLYRRIDERVGAPVG